MVQDSHTNGRDAVALTIYARANGIRTFDSVVLAHTRCARVITPFLCLIKTIQCMIGLTNNM